MPGAYPYLAFSLGGGGPIAHNLFKMCLLLRVHKFREILLFASHSVSIDMRNHQETQNYERAKLSQNLCSQIEIAAENEHFKDGVSAV